MNVPRVTHSLFFLGVSFLPIYSFSSGGLQIAHVLLLLFALSVLATHPVIHVQTAHLLLLALFLLGWLIETIAIFGGGSVGSLQAPLFVLFNLIILVAVSSSADKVDLTRAFVAGLITAATLATAFLFVTGFRIYGSSVTERSIGSFNNPNQLGYFATCVLSLTSLSVSSGLISKLTAIILYAASIFLALASLSKGAMLGIGLGLMLASFSFFTATWARVVTNLAVLGTFFAAFFAVQQGAFNNYLFVARLLGIGSDSDDNLTQRGYFVLFDGASNEFEYLFGLGYEKTLRVLGHEIHSTFLSYFGLYGFVGGLLYISFLLTWVLCSIRTLGLIPAMSIALPPFVYGIAHNGTRFTIFYILIGMTFYLSIIARSRPCLSTSK